MIREIVRVAMRRGAIISGLCAALAVAVPLWWFFGSGLSEETAYRLAVEHAQTYAAQHDIDLSRYDAPAMGSQNGNRLYTFSWASKDNQDGPLTIAVDTKTVEVSIIQSPVWQGK